MDPRIEAKRELRLAIEALVALVDREYPARPLRELAWIHGGSDLTTAHYEAVAKVEGWLFRGCEASVGGGDNRP
jgi:hypothetical protein